jgi:hypothetical protein
MISYKKIIIVFVTLSVLFFTFGQNFEFLNGLIKNKESKYFLKHFVVKLERPFNEITKKDFEELRNIHNQLFKFENIFSVKSIFNQFLANYSADPDFYKNRNFEHFIYFDEELNVSKIDFLIFLKNQNINPKINTSLEYEVKNLCKDTNNFILSFVYFIAFLLALFILIFLIFKNIKITIINTLVLFILLLIFIYITQIYNNKNTSENHNSSIKLLYNSSEIDKNSFKDLVELETLLLNFKSVEKVDSIVKYIHSMHKIENKTYDNSEIKIGSFDIERYIFLLNYFGGYESFKINNKLKIDIFLKNGDKNITEIINKILNWDKNNKILLYDVDVLSD